MQNQPAGINGEKLLTRIASGGIFITVFTVCVLIGNRFFVLPVLCAILGLIGTFEFFQMTGPRMNRFVKALGYLLAVALPLITAASVHIFPQNPVVGSGGLNGLIGLFYAVAIALLCYLGWVAVTPTSRIADAALSFFGGLYLGVPLSFLVLIREMDKGVYLALMVLLSVWAADSFAYLGGSAFGRHKLAPIISPHKSWEGFLCGTLGSIVIWSLLPIATHNRYPFWVAVVLGILISFVSLIGDLFESRVKREADVKDSGTLLPGHGGLLDRLDSTLSVALVMFILLSTLGVLVGVARG